MVETTSRIASSSSTTRIFSVSTLGRLPPVIIREVTHPWGQPCPFRKQHVSVRINGSLSRQRAAQDPPRNEECACPRNFETGSLRTVLPNQGLPAIAFFE